MRVRLSVFLPIDEQWRQNLVKKKQKNKHQRHTQAPLLYVLPFFRSYFDVTHDQPLKKKVAKFDINFLSITYL